MISLPEFSTFWQQLLSEGPGPPVLHTCKKKQKAGTLNQLFMFYNFRQGA